MATWDPAQYLRWSDHRLRPAVDLLQRVPLTSPARVVDLGCGTGNVTALLRAGRADAAQLRRALAHLDLRGGARGALARSTREAHPTRAHEAARVLLGPAGFPGERARRVGDGLHAGAHRRQFRGRLRERLVA